MASYAVMVLFVVDADSEADAAYHVLEGVDQNLQPVITRIQRTVYDINPDDEDPDAYHMGG